MNEWSQIWGEHCLALVNLLISHFYYIEQYNLFKSIIIIEWVFSISRALIYNHQNVNFKHPGPETIITELVVQFSKSPRSPIIIIEWVFSFPRALGRP